MKQKLQAVAAATVLGATVFACDGLTGVACTDEARPGVTVEVRDSISDEVATASATLLVIAGSYRDSVTYGANGSLLPTSMSAAYERPGSYQVIVRRTEYAEWRGSALVRQGECHVETVRLLARLQRI